MDMGIQVVKKKNEVANIGNSWFQCYPCPVHYKFCIIVSLGSVSLDWKMTSTSLSQEAFPLNEQGYQTSKLKW